MPLKLDFNLNCSKSENSKLSQKFFCFKKAII